MDDMGFPAGGPRTMTADLTGKLPQGTRRIRITTNLQIYWDNILVNRAAQDQNSRLTPVPLARADLREQFDLAIQIRDKVSEANNAVIQIRALKTQIADRL